MVESAFATDEKGLFTPSLPQAGSQGENCESFYDAN